MAENQKNIFLKQKSFTFNIVNVLKNSLKLFTLHTFSCSLYSIMYIYKGVLIFS